MPNARRVGELVDRIWTLIGPINVTSGYRCDGLNRAVGGSPLSAHLAGRAVDFVPVLVDVRAAMLQLCESDIPFDKLILEGIAGEWWLHAQVPADGILPRGRFLMCLAPGKFEPWNPHDGRVLSALA